MCKELVHWFKLMYQNLVPQRREREQKYWRVQREGGRILLLTVASAREVQMAQNDIGSFFAFTV